jgi:hypothetical protein
MPSSGARSHSARSIASAPGASPRSRAAIASSSTGFAEKRVICASTPGSTKRSSKRIARSP